MSLPKLLTLSAWAPVIEGAGAALVMTWDVSRQTKGGSFQRSKVKLQVDRYVVRQLAEQIMAMQERDRARIHQELERLVRETSPIVEGHK